MAKSTIERYKSFEKWKAQEVENEFGLKRIFKNHRLLDVLLEKENDIIDFDPIEIKKLQERLAKMEFAWNEFEFQTFFINPILQIVGFQKLKYRIFLENNLKTQLKGKAISGRVNMMLAKNWQIPSNPFFFIEQYKTLTNPNGDPIGQLLIEMVTAQALNNEPEEPIYGCYIIGRNWFFVVLENGKYAISKAYDATETDIYDIVGIFKKIKIMFEQKIGFVEEV